MKHDSKIPSAAAGMSENDGILPQEAAESISNQIEHEGDYYVISFSRYNDTVCEIKNLSNNKARKALQILKVIGTKIRSESDFKRNNIDRIHIRREGEYKKLYRRLPVDVDLKEIKLQQDARIFYFDIEDKRTLYVVAILENHLDTDKVRRG